MALEVAVRRNESRRGTIRGLFSSGEAANGFKTGWVRGRTIARKCKTLRMRSSGTKGKIYRLAKALNRDSSSASFWGEKRTARLPSHMTRVFTLVDRMAELKTSQEACLAFA